LHEIIHTIYYNLGYDEIAEKKVSELEGAIYALIIDNPEMFERETD